MIQFEKIYSKWKGGKKNQYLQEIIEQYNNKSGKASLRGAKRNKWNKIL